MTVEDDSKAMPLSVSYSARKDGLRSKADCLSIAIENIFQKGKDYFGKLGAYSLLKPLNTFKLHQLFHDRMAGTILANFKHT
jgi:hypothetical protein